MSALPLPQQVARLIDGEEEAGSGTPQPGDRGGQMALPSRWHFDGWVSYRGNSQAAALAGTGPGVLGGSQAGIVATWRVAQATGAPALMVRLSAAPPQAGRGDSEEVAAGIRWRPIRKVPVSLQAEMRAIRQASGGVSLRPAALAVGGFDELAMPLKFRLRGYGAVGRVGGKLPMSFAEGHLVADREVAAFDLARVDAGVGAWGAIQGDAARLDAGPSVSLRMPIGGKPARVQLDYRLRLAGDATPGNGPALTLSTGF